MRLFKTEFVCAIVLLWIFAVAPVYAQSLQISPQNIPSASAQWLTIPGGNGPGKGKTVVLISGDEEYRSEESLPQLARILSTRFGFKCIVLFAIDPKDGTVCPNINNNIPGLENLKSASLMIMHIRWRNLPDSQMKWIVDYVESGKPIIGMRTATHAFNLTGSSYQKYTWDSKVPGYEDGFGRHVLGETWIAHHGNHGKEGTRGIEQDSQKKSPILRGIATASIFSTTDVYEVRLPLPGDSEDLIDGEVTESLEPGSVAVSGPKNHPILPIAWTKTYTGTSSNASRVFTTTLGCSKDLLSESFRRLMVNATLWCMGMENKIKASSNVNLVGNYAPSMFEFKPLEAWKPGKAPSKY